MWRIKGKKEKDMVVDSLSSVASRRKDKGTHLLVYIEYALVK
jgi:hypothetical protein